LLKNKNLKAIRDFDNLNDLEPPRLGVREEAGIIPKTLFEKGNPTEKSETQNHRANDLSTPEIYAGWAAKGEEAFKAFKGGSP
jgi:hypothetical protein